MEGDESASRMETALETTAGRRVPVEMSAGVISYEGEPADLVVFRDVTARKREETALRESEQRYRDLSYRDELTGLFNARYLALRGDEEVGVADATGKALALVMMDVDDFKLFNDTWGHPAGDEVLRRLGPRGAHGPARGRPGLPLRRRGVRVASCRAPTALRPRPWPSASARPSGLSASSPGTGPGSGAPCPWAWPRCAKARTLSRSSPGRTRPCTAPKREGKDATRRDEG